MKPLIFNRNILLSIYPLAAAGVLTVTALLGIGSPKTDCASNAMTDAASLMACESAAADSAPPSAERHLVQGNDGSLRLDRRSPPGPRYSERRLRMLNDLKPMPETDMQLVRAIERLSIQQRRFERRYGLDSVAARSVRYRLHDLREHAATGLRYAGHDENGAVVD